MTVGAVSMLFSTASSVASTTASKNGSRARPETGLTAAEGPPLAARKPVASARKISPLPWCAVDPVLARPRPARRASRAHPAESIGASVTTTVMHDPLGGRLRPGL